MPSANGRGITQDLARADQSGGGVLRRLSRARLGQSGAFSGLTGLARILPVVSGPGFWLSGPGVRLHAAKLVPVALDGGAAIGAKGACPHPARM